MTDDDTRSTDPDGTRSATSGREEREAYYPEAGYNLVEISFGRPPGDALTLLNHHPRLSSVAMPFDTDIAESVVYDRYGNAYDFDDVEYPTEAVGTTDADELVELVRTDEHKTRRLALFALTRLAESDPTDALAAVPQVTAELADEDPAVGAEALAVLSSVAPEYPEEVTPAAAAVVAYLSVETPAELRSDAVTVVAAIADASPGAVVDAVPRLAALLQEDIAVDGTLLSAIYRIAGAYPDAVVPVVPQLVESLDASETSRRIGAFGVLGMIAKEHPHAAAESIPAAIRSLDATDPKVRANAAGLLADLADEYPERVLPAVSRVIELLDDADQHARYNATSILARVAEPHPAAVEVAIDPLVHALDDEFAYTRSNACWALGYLDAEAALDRLREIERDDPDEEVRRAASVAVEAITDE